MSLKKRIGARKNIYIESNQVINDERPELRPNFVQIFRSDQNIADVLMKANRRNRWVGEIVLETAKEGLCAPEMVEKKED